MPAIPVLKPSAFNLRQGSNREDSMGTDAGGAGLHRTAMEATPQRDHTASFEAAVSDEMRLAIPLLARSPSRPAPRSRGLESQSARTASSDSAAAGLRSATFSAHTAVIDN